MAVESHEIKLETEGFTDIINITEEITKIISEETELVSGTATIFVVGSTASISTIEYEPGLVKDMDIALEKIAPVKGHYHHHDRWHDDNGSSHVRATLMGPSITVPFTDNEMFLGTWQQIVFIDFDTRARSRRIIVQLLGE